MVISTRRGALTDKAHSTAFSAVYQGPDKVPDCLPDPEDNGKYQLVRSQASLDDAGGVAPSLEFLLSLNKAVGSILSTTETQHSTTYLKPRHSEEAGRAGNKVMARLGYMTPNLKQANKQKKQLAFKLQRQKYLRVPTQASEAPAPSH